MRALVMALLWCGLVQANEADVKKARAHYKMGMAHEQSGSHALAAAEFQTAYSLAPVPEYLARLGDAQRLAGNRDAALEAYKHYLEEDPDGKRASEVAGYVAALSKEPAPSAAPPPPPAPPPQSSVYDFGGSAGGSYPANGNTTGPIVHTTPDNPAVTVHTAPNEPMVTAPVEPMVTQSESPRRHPAWLWPTVGVAAGVVVVAVVLGVGLGVGLSGGSYTYGTVQVR